MTDLNTPLIIHTQYIKDLSFVSPGAPLSLAPGQGAPKLTVNVNMDGKKYDKMDGVPGIPYEVSLSVEVLAASQDDKNLFTLKLIYGLFMTVAEELPEQHHHPLLMIEGPRLAFPFVRQIVADITKDSGFPPLMLTPVNFEKLYRDQHAAQAVN